jgi:hypothetical protein
MLAVFWQEHGPPPPAEDVWATLQEERRLSRADLDAFAQRVVWCPFCETALRVVRHDDCALVALPCECGGMAVRYFNPDLPWYRPSGFSG